MDRGGWSAMLDGMGMATFTARRCVVGAAMALACCLVGLAPAGGETTKEALAKLPEQWRVWLEQEVYPIISAEQRKAFLALESEAQRQAFADRLWVLWGQQTGYGPGFRRMYEDRLVMCRSEFKNTTEDRARILLLHGPPDALMKTRCEELFQPLEFWSWEYIEGIGEGVVVVFVQPDGMGRSRLWNPFEGRQRLYTYEGWQQHLTATSRATQPELQCFDGDTIVRLIGAAEYWLKDPRTMARMDHLESFEKASRESSSARFMEFSALLDDNAEPLDFAVSEEGRGMRGGKVKMGFTIRLPSEGLGRAEVGAVEVVQLDVVGEISHEAQMVDRFRYLFTVPSAGTELALLLERAVRPGAYDLRLKVEDTHSKKGGVKEVRFAAAPTAAVAPPAPAQAPAAAAVAAALPADNVPTPMLLLVGPDGESVSGLQRFEALARPDVAKVVFWVDDHEVLTKNRPPFEADLDLGPLPRLTTVAGVAYDAGGRELDRKELTLNVGRERFFVRLRPLAAGEAEKGKVRVAADLNTPSDAPLDRLELYFNERLLATLFQPPYEAWVGLDRSDSFGYLRAVAYLADGSQAEDIEFVNAPRFGEVVDVTAVELPVTVLDRSGKPVEDIRPEELRVVEDGVEQKLSEVTLHRDLPVRLGIVVDTSGSMELTLPAVQKVVMGFLKGILRPRDRAFVASFSDRVDLLSGFEADFQVLENALLALYADRSTALYDAVISGLFQFSGARGRKAMVVISDGEDNASKHTYEDALKFAQRSGVTLYTIGIDLPATKVMVRYQLKHLAETTGGRGFLIRHDSELDEVYETIDRELRSQYLLAYTSSSERPPGELREVKVEVARSGVRVRTIAGYYPGG
jgi:Ca-activated chloride channel homolog